jgi:hypothetical protein
MISFARLLVALRRPFLFLYAGEQRFCTGFFVL